MSELNDIVDQLRAPSLSKAARLVLVDELMDELNYGEAEDAELRRAAHMLHEQAHGQTPWIACQVEPCASLALEDGDRGPAPLTLL